MKEKKTSNKLKYMAWLMFPLVILIWIVSAGLCVLFIPEQSDRGTFGDMFGAVNALFTGLAFAGLVFTILLQRKDIQKQSEQLELQREDLQNQTEQLSLQKEELKLTREEMAGQGDVFRMQRFEDSFYNMMKLLNDTVDTLEIQSGKNIIKGKTAFQIHINRLELFYKEASNSGVDFSSKAAIENMYESYYQRYQAQIGPYFRILYRIIRLIEKNIENENEAKDYVKVVRAQQSNYQLRLLFYNGLSSYAKDFKPLIEKYTFLKHLDKGQLFDPKHRDFYEKEAFKETES